MGGCSCSVAQLLNMNEDENGCVEHIRSWFSSENGNTVL